MIVYVDSNIFISAVIDEGRTGANCSKVLQMISERRILCASSFLTLDEVLYVLGRKTSKDASVRIAKSLLTMPIRWIEVDRATMMGMIEAVEKEGLRPRDAIHLASMRLQGIATIISEDADFDKVQGIERMTSSEILKSHSE